MATEVNEIRWVITGMVFRRCHIHIYDNWGTSYLVSRLVPANIVAPRIIAWNDNYLRWKREQLTYGEIMVLSVFRVEHAIVVVEFYAIVFPLCKYISTPKSDRKSH